ncbi:MAG TPA: hypothetical protein VJQ82_27600 [Terriglobales bacterium]|nr:hypothetical protein [Terriglobales bacterium]
MKHSTRIGLILMLSLCLAPLSRAAKPKTAIDEEYVSALGTANRFLHAWQVQDHETGVLMLTDAAKQHMSEDALDAFFSLGPGREEGFEIIRGKRLAPGRYEFPVVLWHTVSGKNGKPHPSYSKIVVVRTGKDEWAIDKLP